MNEKVGRCSCPKNGKKKGGVTNEWGTLDNVKTNLSNLVGDEQFPCLCEQGPVIRSEVTASIAAKRPISQSVFTILDELKYHLSDVLADLFALCATWNELLRKEATELFEPERQQTPRNSGLQPA